MKRLSILLALACCLSFCGCEPCPHYNRLQVASYCGPVKAPEALRKPYGTIRPYRSEQEIGRPFEVIGFMSCQGSSAEEGGILQAMLYRAADMGADGLLLGGAPQVGMRTASTSSTPPDFGASNATPGGVGSGPAPRPGELRIEQHIDLSWGWATGFGNGDHATFRAQPIRFKK